MTYGITPSKKSGVKDVECMACGEPAKQDDVLFSRYKAGSAEGGWVHDGCSAAGVRRWLRAGRPGSGPLEWLRQQRAVWTDTPGNEGSAWHVSGAYSGTDRLQ